MTEHRLSRREAVQQMIAVAAAPFVVGCGMDRLLSPGPSFGSAASSVGPIALIGGGDPHLVRMIGPQIGIGQKIKAMLDADPNAYAFVNGDLVQNGLASEYRDWYDPTWGAFKERTLFTMGNHDRKADPFGVAYYNYVGELGGSSGKGYYAKTLGAWRCYFLNSEHARPEQVAWLAADLPKWRNYHIMAMWHTPMFATPCRHNGKSMAWPGNQGMGPFWQAMQDHGAEFVVSGHVHRWERFPRMLRTGTVSSKGVRQFIAGVGGITPMPFLSAHPTVQSRVVARGIARFELHADRYKWKFTDTNGTVRDSGTQFCRKAL